MRAESEARRTVCSDYFVHGIFLFVCFRSRMFLIVFSALLSDGSKLMVSKRCVRMRARVCVRLCVFRTLHLYNN